MAVLVFKQSLYNLIIYLPAGNENLSSYYEAFCSRNAVAQQRYLYTYIVAL
jgi:hypothetical protein